MFIHVSFKGEGGLLAQEEIKLNMYSIYSYMRIYKKKYALKNSGNLMGM